MPLRDDSYSSLAEVTPYLRYRLKGHTEFTADTTPTRTELEKVIDRMSGVLNIALQGAGFSAPLNSTTANSTAVLIADDWVTMAAVKSVEKMHPGAAVVGDKNKRVAAWDATEAACEWVNKNSLALKRAGATVTHKLHEGLAFTGMKDREDRTDPDNPAREQPKFHRGLFDNPRAGKRWDSEREE